MPGVVRRRAWHLRAGTSGKRRNFLDFPRRLLHTRRGTFVLRGSGVAGMRMTSARCAARWRTSHREAVHAWSGCVQSAPADHRLARDARFGMPRPRCSITVGAETWVGVGGWSVVGGGGSRVSAGNQQARCHRFLARVVAAERTQASTPVIAIDARRPDVFRTGQARRDDASRIASPMESARRAGSCSTVTPSGSCARLHGPTSVPCERERDQ